MFEKEAEEYANRCACLMEDIPIIERAYRNGAEFGYNKAFVEADKNLKAVVADFNKGNEWHYVKDGDLPKETNEFYVYSKEWGVEVRKFFADVGYFECRKNIIVAWKEILLPKEIKNDT